MGDGILDAAVGHRIETFMRPEDKRWGQWAERQQAAITRALDVCEQECAAWGAAFLIGQITVAVALDYIDFRKSLADWRAGRPALAAWHKATSTRPSLVATLPKE